MNCLVEQAACFQPLRVFDLLICLVMSLKNLIIWLLMYKNLTKNFTFLLKKRAEINKIAFYSPVVQF